MTALARPLTARPRARAGGGLLPAGLALLAAPLHVAVLAAHPHDPVTTTALLAMTAWCALCAARLLRGRGEGRREAAAGTGRREAAAGTGRRKGTLGMLLASAVVMVLAHAAMVAGLPGIGSGHHHGGAVAVQDAGAARAMLGVVALELGVALTAALALRRRG